MHLAGPPMTDRETALFARYSCERTAAFFTEREGGVWVGVVGSAVPHPQGAEQGRAEQTPTCQIHTVNTDEQSRYIQGGRKN
jgi:hypothetical protein